MRQIPENIKTVQLGGFDNAVAFRTCISAFAIIGEHPVVTSDGKRSYGTFSTIADEFNPVIKYSRYSAALSDSGNTVTALSRFEPVAACITKEFPVFIKQRSEYFRTVFSPFLFKHNSESLICDKNTDDQLC